MQIGIIGSAGPEEYKGKKPNKIIYKYAEEVGMLLAERGCIVITGGKGGVMESAFRGAKKNNGTTVSVVKGSKRGVSNKFTDIEIIANTSAGGEELILTLSCDGIIIIGGGAGTLQEIASAYRNSKPMVAIETVDGFGKYFANKFLDDRKIVKIKKASTPKKAVELLLRELGC